MKRLITTWNQYKWFLILWFIINIIQALFTNLHYDEAYYWLYSQKLSWGYFDHPPMVALLAKIGDTIHHSALGIRILPIFMGVCVLFGVFHLIEDNINRKEVILFTITFPLITSHAAGFLILPDAPLVFFFVLYLFSYKQYLKDDNFKNIFIFSLIISAMIFSKYHAGLIIVFTILSNTQLLNKKSLWLVGALSALFLLPHFIWQYNNNFPSFLYHISDRAKGFELLNFGHHIYSQILLAGPFSGIIILWLAFKFQPKTQFDKTLKYIVFGFYIFFLLYCFKGKVEAHWTSVSTIALIIIAYKELQFHLKIKKILPYLLFPTLFLLFIARIILAGDHLEKEISFKTNFVNTDTWAAELDSISEGHPILFTNKYHNLSTYSFSKDRWTPGAPHYNNRFSQIDLNKIDSIYNGKKIFALNYGSQKKWKSKNNTKHRGSFIDSYYSYTGLIIDSISLNTYNDSLFLTFKLINQTNKSFIFNKDNEQRLQLNYSINNYKHKKYFSSISKIELIKPFENIQFQLLVTDSLNLSNLNLDIGISSNNMRVFRLRNTKYKIK